ncbi:hypothetical protein QQS21_002034 [Conoideocrella luteorostrata]|uniref:Uncharacterized protein n=1 Tax=Conoideocrella luteorostrata TaxID=1105319 RepID=A0AAJ0CWT5_9HYPO|nr:hypothetical protein QQS21_002034 [Conoideocrella luteorostrata]
MFQSINTVIPVKLRNSFLVDHYATKRAAAIALKENQILRQYAIQEKNSLDELLEPHLPHRHFDPHGGEILVHRDLYVAGNGSHAPIQIGVA